MDSGKAALALSTVALVPSIYGLALPNLAETRAQPDDDGHLSAGEKYAALIAGGIVLGVAGVTRSPEVAAAGLVAVVAFSAAYRVSVRTVVT